MLFRSTGLGKRELVAEIVAVTRQDDCLIMAVETSEPVRWVIRGGVLSGQVRSQCLRAGGETGGGRRV